MIARIISDNGYKIEMIRPLRECPFSLGTTVNLEEVDSKMDLVELFEKQLDEDTQARIMLLLNEAQK